MARPPGHRRPRPTPAAPVAPTDNTEPSPMGKPVFAQPQPTADPTQFHIRHPSDDAAYKTIDQLNAEHKLGPMPFPAPRGEQSRCSRSLKCLALMAMPRSIA